MFVAAGLIIRPSPYASVSGDIRGLFPALREVRLEGQPPWRSVEEANKSHFLQTFVHAAERRQELRLPLLSIHMQKGDLTRSELEYLLDLADRAARSNKTWTDLNSYFCKPASHYRDLNTAIPFAPPITISLLGLGTPSTLTLYH